MENRKKRNITQKKRPKYVGHGPTKKRVATECKKVEHVDNEYIVKTGSTPIRSIPPTKFIKPLSAFDDDDSHWAFLFFFKQLLMQPFVREYFVTKNRPDYEYYMIKIDFADTYYCQKIDFMKSKLQECKENGKNVIIDIAEQLVENGGGHYTSLRHENGETLYMDSDPFYYGAEGDNHKDFHAFVRPFHNPITIYGDNNKARTKLGAKKSIQNLHRMDTFCQSWSLLFITLDNTSETYKTTHRKLQFQEKNPIGHATVVDIENMEDTETKAELQETYDIMHLNFDKFINNFLVLLDFWKDLIDNDQKFTKLLKKTPFRKWTSATIVNKLDNLKEYIVNNTDSLRENYDNVFCVYHDILNDYITNK